MIFFTTTEKARACTKAAKKEKFYFRTLTKTNLEVVKCETNEKGYKYIKDNIL